MVDPKDTRGAPPREIHIEKKKTNWLAWIALILGIEGRAEMVHRDDMVLGGV